MGDLMRLLSDQRCSQKTEWQVRLSVLWSLSDSSCRSGKSAWGERELLILMSLCGSFCVLAVPCGANRLSQVPLGEVYKVLWHFRKLLYVFYVTTVYILYETKHIHAPWLSEKERQFKFECFTEEWLSVLSRLIWILTWSTLLNLEDDI